MKLLGSSLALFLFMAPLIGGSLHSAEREQLVKHLAMSSEAFLTAVKGLNAEQLNYRPDPESWTILECAEHIALSEGNMFDEFHEKFLSLTPRSGISSATTDAEVLRYGTDRESQKSKAAESYQPTGRWGSLEEIITHFRSSRNKTMALARQTKDDLRGRYLEAYQLDGYQYLLILSAHCQRHSKQIQEIKQSAGFPR